jgi:two-component SAPR family response regulator
MKPITAEKVKKELMNLRHPLQSRPGTKLQVKCFGNFDVCLPDGTPLQFARAKSKELLAYLVYRKGTPCSVRELAAVLFEDSDYDRKQQVYLQKIISSMMQTLKQHDLASVVQKRYNSICLDVSVLDCDYYRFLELDPAAINAYTGEFLSQYSWAEFMTGYLDRLTEKK